MDRRGAIKCMQHCQHVFQLPATPSASNATENGKSTRGENNAVRRRWTTAKRYGVLLTCLAIRAVHIEVVYSLDTECFINTLQRFIARRGRPEQIRSDNGANFVKGEKELCYGIKRRFTNAYYSTMSSAIS